MLVEAHEVPTIEVERTEVVPVIKAGRTQAESSERAGALPAKEEAKDESLGGHLIEATKVTHEWIGLSSLPLPLCNRLVIVDVVL